jgi:tRNA threonylcarbamoyladenosine biosynthesis protein TsaB
VNLLAIETATTACAIGLRVDDRDVEALLDADRHHTEVLTVGIQALLDRAHVEVRSIDRIVVDQGPGLFTGLRVGLATAEALAFGLGAELVGVTSLELLAHGAWRHGVRGTLLALVDARRGELFVQTFDLGDAVVASDAPHVATPSVVRGRFADSAHGVTVTGDGAARYASEFDGDGPWARFDQRVPPVTESLALGARREPRGVVAPLYLREADAVANFATRERPR